MVIQVRVHHPIIPLPVPNPNLKGPLVAVIDLAGYIAGLKDQAVEHGFHVHDERHFVETYSMRQAWEVDLHGGGHGGARWTFRGRRTRSSGAAGLRDHIMELREAEEPEDRFTIPLIFTWSLLPLPSGPDLLVLATDLAGVGGTDHCPSRSQPSTPTPR